MNATKAQLARLQTVYAQLAKREIGVDSSRAARLVWASGLLKRQIASFSDLSVDDARHLIDQAQRELGHAMPPQNRPGAAAARRAGLDGRYDGQEFASMPQMVSADDLATISAFRARLGWSQERLDAFLASPRSPFAKRGDKSIRTAADANQVRWALKRMLKRAGLWEERRAS